MLRGFLLLPQPEDGNRASGLAQTMLGGPIQDCEGKTGVGSLRVFRLALTRGLETRKEVLKLLLNPVSGEFRLGPFTRLS